MHDEVALSPEVLTAEVGEGVSRRDMEFPKGFIDAVLRLRKPDIPDDPRRLDEELSERSDVAVLLAEFDYSPEKLTAMRRGALAVILAEEQLSIEAQQVETTERRSDTSNVVPMRGRGASSQELPAAASPAAVAQ